MLRKPRFWWGFTPFGGILACGCHEFVGLSAGAGLDSGSKCSGAREGPDRGGHPGLELLAAPYHRCAQSEARHGTHGAGEAMGKLRDGNGGVFGVTGRAEGTVRGCCPAGHPPTPPPPPQAIWGIADPSSRSPCSSRGCRTPAPLPGPISEPSPAPAPLLGVSLALTLLHPSCAGPGHARPAQPAPPRLIDPPGLITASLAPDAPPKPAAPQSEGLGPPLSPDFGVTKHPPSY